MDVLRFAVRARALPRRSTSSPLSLEIFGIAIYAIVLDSDNVGYKIHWNWGQNKISRHMVIQFDNLGNGGEDAAYRRSYTKPYKPGTGLTRDG